MAADDPLDDDPVAGEWQWFLQAIRLPREQREKLLAGKEVRGEKKLSQRLLDLLRHDELLRDNPEAESQEGSVNGNTLCCRFDLSPDEIERLEAGSNPGFAESRGFPRLNLGDKVDHLRVIHFIAEGGMGVVYLAEDTAVRRHVALKVLTYGSVERFEQETIAVATLEHPHIVRLYASGVYAGRPYYAMEYVPGETFQEQIKRSPTSGLPSLAAAKLLSEVGRAVAYAHSKGVLHRDIKPSNIFIDNEGKPRVGDFGLAKILGDDSDLTRSGEVFGSPQYMAPEQTLTTEIETSEATDVYGLGATLYAAIVGRPPFQGDRPWQVLELVASQEPVLPSRLVAGVPHDLETICLKCLEKNPQQRYPSADAFADDLDRFLRKEPILARPVSRLEKARRWCLRRPASAALVLAACLLLVSLGGWTAREFQTRREAKSRLSETLVVRSELFAQQGKWREALRDLDEAERLGHPDPGRVQLLRVRGLVAVNDSDAYFQALERLGKMGPLGPHAGEAHLIRGLSLLMSKNPEAAGAEFESALSAENLASAKRAIAKAMMASTSNEVVLYLEQAVDGDPTSYFAHQYLASILMLLGRYEEAETNCRVAEVLFPESPTFPMLRILAASARGDREQKYKLLEHPALRQLESSSLGEFIAALSAFHVLQEAVTRGFDFDLTREEFLANQEEMAKSAAPFIARLSSLTAARETVTSASQGNEQLLAQIGIPSFQRAYDLFTDAVSLRTFGFLLTGKGDIQRIDRLINQLERAFEIHPDGIFQFCRGRLLYARGRLAEATQAYSLACEHPSIIRIIRIDAAYAAARCCLERYEAGETDVLELAANYLHRRLEYSTPKPKHAEVLLKVAEASRDYATAEKLAPLVEAGSALAVRMGKIALLCGRFEKAIQHCAEVPESSSDRPAAEDIMRGVEQELRSQLLQVAPLAE